MVALFDQQFKQLDKIRKEAKAKRDAETQNTPAYLKWDKEYKQLFQAASDTRKNIDKVKNTINAVCQDPFPFSHPFYWAAFTCSGLR
jgi:GTP-binding protein EngB required for normal cell division